jgi:hypothetical protein
MKNDKQMHRSLLKKNATFCGGKEGGRISKHHSSEDFGAVYINVYCWYMNSSDKDLRKLCSR